jgi:tRNAHis guanylyltransferase
MLVLFTKFSCFMVPLELSRYAYVRRFEAFEKLLLNTWIVVRVDGRGFHS